MKTFTEDKTQKEKIRDDREERFRKDFRAGLFKNPLTGLENPFEIEKWWLNELDLAIKETEEHLVGEIEKLFISVNVSTFIEADFEQSMLLNFLEEFGIAPSSIVIELKEYQPTDNSDLMLRTALQYRDMGYGI